MAQPSESQSQPPPEASLDKLHVHHPQDGHHQQNGLQPPPTEGTRAITTGGGNSHSSTRTTSTATTTTTTSYTSTGGGSSCSTTAAPVRIEASGGGDTSDRPPNETSLAVEPASAPHEAAHGQEPTASSHHNGENGTHNSSSDAQSPPSPSMSNAHHPPGPHRQQVGYPSPTSFPSPGMPPTAQYAYPPQPGPHVDPYRASPTAVNTPMSLPSMRTIDPHQQQHAHGMAMGPAMGGPMPAGAGQIYYNMSPHTYAMHPDPNALRYALPPNVADPRIALSGGRHKKVGRHLPGSARFVDHIVLGGLLITGLLDRKSSDVPRQGV